MSPSLIAIIQIFCFISMTKLAANQGDVCKVKPPDTHLWRNCAISAYTPVAKAACECVGCSGHRTIIECNTQGQWQIAEDDITKICSKCQTDATCAYDSVCDYRRISETRRCRCNRNCQVVTSTCKENWIWEHSVSTCHATSGIVNIQLAAEQPAVNWNSTKSGLQFSCTNGFTTLNFGSATCFDGKLSNILPPSCSNSPCGPTPTGLNCNFNNRIISTSARCTCNHNCRNIDIECHNGHWKYDTNICSDIYKNYEFKKNDGTVKITALKLRGTDKFDFEVHCPEGEIVVHNGSASCDNGELNFSKPTCGKPCNQIPLTVKCSEITEAKPGERRNCVCKKICRNVQLRCEINGTWTNDYRCSEDYFNKTFYIPNAGKYDITARKSGNNFKHIVYCSQKYATISSGLAVCNNAELNITQHPICEPPCEAVPSNVNCSVNSTWAFFNATRHCTCTYNATVNTTLRCSSGGEWIFETPCPASNETQPFWVTPVAATVAILLVLLVAALVYFVHKTKRKRETNSLQVIFQPEEVDVENEFYYPAEGIPGVRESVLQGYSTIEEMREFVKPAEDSTRESENDETLYDMLTE